MKNKLKTFVKKYFSSFAFFYGYLRNTVFLAFFANVIVSILDGLGIAMFFPLLQVVGDEDGVINMDEMGNLSYLIEGIEKLGINLTVATVLMVMFVFFLLKAVARYYSGVYMVILQQRFIRKIRLELLNFLNRINFKKFINADVGRIQNTMTGEVDRVSLAFRSYFSAFRQGAMILVYLGFAFFMDPKFALLVTLGGGLTNILYRVIYKHTLGLSRKLTTYNHQFQGEVIQYVGKFKYLKTTGRTRQYASKLKDTVYDMENSRRKIGELSTFAIVAREPMLVAIIAVIIFVQLHFFNGSIGAIFISLIFFYRALTSLMTMQQSWNTFMENAGSLENLRDFQNTLGKSREKDGKEIFQTFEYSIELENVGFSYGSTPILTNINLSIEKNKTVAFAGESGSGKTTLVSLIAGLMHEDKGSITVDGIPLKEIKKESYQNRLGYVSQDPVIFDDSIFNNITFWANPTPENKERFSECIHQASIDRFIEELPKKEETMLGHNGINLSGGQKQRISIARELFKDVDILMLDEATSALDSETEKEIQESIDSLKGKYTILIIAHRLSTIKDADLIVLMDKGEIVGIDTFDALLAGQTKFRKMVELQEF